MVKTIEISYLNKCLENLNALKKISEWKSDDYYSEKKQGEVGKSIIVYELKDSLYLRVTKESDSYGKGLGITEIQIVEPIVKQVTDFVTI